MAYSSIKRPTCKCGCGKYPTISYGGWNFKCASQEIKDKVGSKKQAQQKTRNARSRVRSLSQYQDNISGGGSEMQRWFEDRRKEMTGVCSNCGGKSCKDSDVYFKFSIAHLLPKAYFPSVKTHPDNWIELCHFGKSCHTNMDNKMLDLTEMACWDEIVTKFCIMYPHILPNEKRRIPKVLLNYIETEK